MLKGIAASGGFATGKIFWLEPPQSNFSLHLFQGEGEERRRLEKASTQFKEAMEQTAASLRRIVGKEEADIFQGHICIADDPEFRQQLHKRIYWGLNAETAAETALDEYITRFSQADAAFTRTKAADILDVKQTFLQLLSGQPQKRLCIPFGSVLAAKELTPSAVRFLDRRRTVAIVTQTGERCSHLAVLARAMGIPAVLSIGNLSQAVKNGQKVIVDGNKGEVIPI